jgi:hypothetical protein
VSWNPAASRPPEADVVEAQIAALMPAAEVRLNHSEEGWRVRALLPAAMCGRGATFADRDVSSRVIEILEDAGLSARR